MKREAKMLLSKATDSLINSIECFNKTSEVGRQTIVLILLNHSFEMLVKAAIIERKGNIIGKGDKETYSFGKCLRKALTEEGVKFLSDDQVLLLQAMNALRNAAHHYLIDISEQLLYVYAQSSITLFQDILKDVFCIEICTVLPSRVLPISTLPPRDLISIFESDINKIKELLSSGKRQNLQAMAKLSSLAILENALSGVTGQPNLTDIRKISKRVKQGESWASIFRGVSSINISQTQGGSVFNLRITKNQGIPVSLVPEGTTSSAVIAIRNVNDTDFYNLGVKDLAYKCQVTTPKMSALIWSLGLKEDVGSYKQIRIGKSFFDRFSPKALDRLKHEIVNANLEDVWDRYKQRAK